MLTEVTCVLLVCVAAFAYDLKFDYQIKNGKAKFIENVETNLEKNIVKYHTPAHNDVLESYKMQDFTEGKQITCLPSLRQCRLRDIDISTNEDAGQVTESYVHSWNEGVHDISSTDSQVITELYYIDEEDVVEIHVLGNGLREFYESFKYPLYQEKKIPSDAKILNITNSHESRSKRGFRVVDPGCGGQMEMVYGVVTGRSGNYLRKCGRPSLRNGRYVLPRCQNVHISSPIVYACVCCPGVTIINLAWSPCSCVNLG